MEGRNYFLCVEYDSSNELGFVLVSVVCVCVFVCVSFGLSDDYYCFPSL